MLKARLKNYNKNILYFDALDKNFFNKKNYDTSNYTIIGFDFNKIENLIIIENILGFKFKIISKLQTNPKYLHLGLGKSYYLIDDIINIDCKDINIVMYSKELKVKDLLTLNTYTTLNKKISYTDKFSLKLGE